MIQCLADTSNVKMQSWRRHHRPEKNITKIHALPCVLSNRNNKRFNQGTLQVWYVVHFQTEMVGVDEMGINDPSTTSISVKFLVAVPWRSRKLAQVV